MVDSFVSRLPEQENGFTLVELLVAVLIIGALVAIAIPVYTPPMETARSNALLADIRTFESIIGAYRFARSEEPAEAPEKDDSDDAWNQYARDHLDAYVSGGWPTETPFGGVYAYGYYDGSGNASHFWLNTSGPGQSHIKGAVDGDRPFDIIALRFQDGGDYDTARQVLLESQYANRVFQHEENGEGLGLAILIR